MASGERTFICNVGRQSGKTTALGIWALIWERGVLAGGHIAICTPSSKHTADLKDKIKRWLGELATPSPAGLGFDVLLSNGRIDFWELGPNAIAPGRGRAYEAVVIDEAAYVPGLKAILQENLEPTLSTTGGPVILGSTPCGKNDFYDLWRSTPPIARFSGGSELNPAITAAWLKDKRRRTIETRYLQEYEAAFTDQIGSLLKRDKVRYGTPPPLETFKTISFGIDAAISVKTTADYSALAVCGVDQQDRRWVLHLAHWRAVWADSEAKIIGFYHAWRPHIVAFESVAFAALGCRALLNAGVPCRPVVPHKDKATRFERVLVRYHMAEVWHSDGLDTECENELFAFGFDTGGKPLSSHDDCVDSLELAISPLFAELSSDWSDTSDRGRQWGPAGGNLPHEIPELQIGGRYVWQIHGYETKAQYLEACAKEEAEASEPEVYEPSPLAPWGGPAPEHNPDLPVSGGVLTTRYMPLADGSQALFSFRNGKWER